MSSTNETNNIIYTDNFQRVGASKGDILSSDAGGNFQLVTPSVSGLVLTSDLSLASGTDWKAQTPLTSQGQNLTFSSSGAIGGANQTLYLVGNGTVSNVDGSYFFLSGNNSATVKDLYVWMNTSPGANVTFRILRNGLPTVPSLELTTTATTASNTSVLVPFAIGDRLSLEFTTTTATNLLVCSAVVTYIYT
jgi:hypothetical protein